MKILITGGAGFVGSYLAKAFRDEGASVTVLDNLKRRGSELNLAEFQRRGIDFKHGDIRQRADLDVLPDRYDLFIEASAEPSVLAGLDGAPDYLLQTNLVGTLNCLEFARRSAAAFLFLSTSRVYSIDALRALPLSEGARRLDVAPDSGGIDGLSSHGINEDFSVSTARSLYGASKLASELFVQEYQNTYGLPCLINRCGVIAGPGQFGKVDQGVFTLWMARHYFQKGLQYTGFGGTGKQVRDLLHPRDLFALIKKQIPTQAQWRAETYNVGGGLSGSLSMLELTGLCQEISGKTIPIAAAPQSHPMDIPYYVSDSRRVSERFGWRPETKTAQIFEEIHSWILANEGALKSIFA